MLNVLASSVRFGMARWIGSLLCEDNEKKAESEG